MYENLPDNPSVGSRSTSDGQNQHPIPDGPPQDGSRNKSKLFLTLCIVFLLMSVALAGVYFISVRTLKSENKKISALYEEEVKKRETENKELSTENASLKADNEAMKKELDEFHQAEEEKKRAQEEAEYAEKRAIFEAVVRDFMSLRFSGNDDALALLGPNAQEDYDDINYLFPPSNTELSRYEIVQTNITKNNTGQSKVRIFEKTNSQTETAYWVETLIIEKMESMNGERMFITDVTFSAKKNIQEITAEWKRYENAEYGFAIQYDAHRAEAVNGEVFSVSFVNGSESVESDTDDAPELPLRIILSQNAHNLSLAQWASSYFGEGDYEANYKIFGPAYKKYDSKTDKLVILTLFKDQLLEFTCNDPYLGSHEEICALMIATFEVL
ncbi:MAG TPA: hypothetical protein VJA22_00960 [Patescibacteria group bacterium]|nr:hypothetical protein [Patescibacteria group bacterium]